MKTNFLLTLVLFLFFGIAKSQETVSCVAQPSQQHVTAWKNPNSVFNKRLQFVKNYSIENLKNVEKIQFQNNNFQLIQKSSNKSAQRGELLGVVRNIPIVAHILRRSNRTGGISEADIQASIDRANVTYESLNMRFFIDQVKYIDSSTKYNTTYGLDEERAGLSVSSNNVARSSSRPYVVLYLVLESIYFT